MILRLWFLVILAGVGALAPSRAGARGAETRTWDFFPQLAESRQENEPQVADSHQGFAVCGYELASGYAQAAETVINPSAVRFSQNSIGATFKNGQSIDDVARALRGPGGDQLAAQFPPIRLVERNGQLFTLDNRRLAAFSAADRPIPYRMATPAEAAKDSFKFTTTAEQGWGQFIEVRPPR
ncbi:MAG: hypothetical protein ACREIA_08990 [Opitutaceae bacterium]